MNIYEENLKNYCGFSQQQMKDVKLLIKDMSNKTEKSYCDILEKLYLLSKKIKGE